MSAIPSPARGPSASNPGSASTGADVVVARGDIMVTARSLPADTREAGTLSMLWAQSKAAAAGARSSDEYADAYVSALAGIGWLVTDSSRFDAGTTSTTTPSSVVADTIRTLASSEQAAISATLLETIGRAEVPSALSSALTTWWASVTRSATGQAFSVAPLTMGDHGATTMTLADVSFDVTASSWQSFFVAGIADHQVVRSGVTELQLDRDIWGAIVGDLERAVGAALRSSVEEVTI